MLHTQAEFIALASNLNGLLDITPCVQLLDNQISKKRVFENSNASIEFVTLII